jgi:preprotein translocase subunit SecA
MGLEGGDLDADALAEIGVREALIEHLKAAVDETLEAREKQLGLEVWAQVERLILLRTIDTLWVDHLTELDDMRRGIGLRGYGGIDPLNEFKREAFKLYEELRGFISRQVANTIFRVQVTAVPQPQTTTAAAPVQATARSTTAQGDGAGSTFATPALAGAAAAHGRGWSEGRAAIPARRAARGGRGAAAPGQRRGRAQARSQRNMVWQRQEIQARHGAERA